MQTKVDLKCVQKLFKYSFHSKQTQNRIYIPIVNTLATHLMPRLRPNANSLNGRKYSSLWFALKAIQNNRQAFGLKLDTSCLLIDSKSYRSDQMNDSAADDGSDGNACEPSMNGLDETNPMKGIEVIEIDDKKCLVLLTKTDIIYELTFGAIRLTLLSDTVDIDVNGYTLTTDATIDVNAVFGHKVFIKCRNNGNENKTILANDMTKRLQTLGVQEIDPILTQLEDNSCLLLIERQCLSSLLYLESIDTFRPPNLSDHSVWYEFRSAGTNSYDYMKVWDQLFDDLKFNKTDVIVVTGGRNVGKSSLIRYFINKVLSQKPFDATDGNHCLYLDCDPGQSEFSTAAQISLTRVEKPLVSSTPLNVTQLKPLMACSVGATTAAKEPKLYISCFEDIINYFKNNLHKSGPLFVNTMGWTQDLGLALLTDIIKMSSPTHVIQIDSTVDNKINFPFDLTAESVKKYNGFRLGRTRSLDYRLSIIGSNNKVSKRSQTTRELQQLSYMSQMTDIVFKTFQSMTPFKILWSDVFLHIICDARIPSHLYLDALNCSWIQLCRIQCQRQRTGGKDVKIVDTIDGNQCMGSAIIRGIDFRNKCFYILSPESEDILKSINCFVKPSGLQIPEQIIREQLRHSFHSSLPYIGNKF